MACWSGGSWKAAVCLVFHQSALNQRAPSVLEHRNSIAQREGETGWKKREKSRKEKRRGRFECKEQVDKRFPLDLDWQHLNAYTLGYCLHSLKAQYSAIYFEAAFVVDFEDMLAACYLPKRIKGKNLKWGLFHCSHVLLWYQPMTKVEKYNFHRSTDPQQQPWIPDEHLFKSVGWRTLLLQPSHDIRLCNFTQREMSSCNFCVLCPQML